MGGKSRKHANQMFHKREQLGTHTDALFSARRESEEDSTQKPQGRSAGPDARTEPDLIIKINTKL